MNLQYRVKNNILRFEKLKGEDSVYSLCINRIVVKCSVLGGKGPGFQQPPPLLAVKQRVKVVREGRWGRGGLVRSIRAWVWEPDRPGLVFRGVPESTLAGGSTFLILRLLICKTGGIVIVMCNGANFRGRFQRNV